MPGPAGFERWNRTPLSAILYLAGSQEADSQTLGMRISLVLRGLGEAFGGVVKEFDGRGE